MKRAVALLAVVTTFAGFTFACSSGSEDSLKGGGTSGNIANAGDDDSTPSTAPAPATTNKTTAASTVQASSTSDAGTTADASKDPLAACDPSTTTTFEACAECCATKQPAVADLNSCACGTNSQCGSACGQSLCTGGIPSIDCALCLVQANCDFSNAETDPSTSASAGGSCLEQCSSKQF